MTEPATGAAGAPPGVPAPAVLRLAASAFVVLAAEPLYLLVDTAVVGHLGAVQLAGLGVAGAVLSLLLLVGSFVEYGTTGRVARAHGAGRQQAALAEGLTATWLAVGIGLVLVVAGELAAAPAAAALAGGHGDVTDAAVSWLRIGLLGLPGVLVVLAGNGWMRGVQRTREPVLIVLAANVLSALASPLLVFPAGLGLRGSAVANVVAQVVGAALSVRALAHATPTRRPRAAIARAQLVVGRDLVVRDVGFQVAFLTAAAAAGRAGTAPLAAHQVGLQLWTLTALLLDAFAIAAQSLVGAALGGSDAATARRVAWQVARYGLAAGLTLAAVFTAAAWVLPSVFTTSPEVRSQIGVLWPWFVAMLPAAGVVFALDGVLLGAGDVTYLAVLTLVGGVGAFAPLNLAAVRFGWGLSGVWAGLTAFIAVRLIGMLLRVRGNRWVVLGAG